MSMGNSSKDLLAEAHIRNLKNQLVRLMLRSGIEATSIVQQSYSENNILYKSEYIKQEELIPEEGISEYYNNFYTLKDLVKWIKNEEKWEPSFKGDCNLDQDMNFSVYTRRWGHRDCYRIKRTINGWSIQAIAINGDSKKNGEGKILENLRHDYIFYYESGVNEAFEYLWNMADDHEMTVSELAKKLQDIDDWI